MEPKSYNRLHGALLYPSSVLHQCAFYAGPAPEYKVSGHGEEAYFYDNMPTLEYETCRPTAAGVTVRVLPKSVLRFLNYCKFNTAGHLIAMHPSMLMGALHAWNSAVHKQAEPPHVPVTQLLRPGIKLPKDAPPVQSKDILQKFCKENLVTQCKSMIHVGEEVGPMADCIAYLPYPICRECWKQLQRPSPKWVQLKRLSYILNETCVIFPEKLQKFPLLYILRGMLIHGLKSTKDVKGNSVVLPPPLLITEYLQLGLRVSVSPLLTLLSLSNSVMQCANALGPQTFHTWKTLCRGRLPKLSDDTTRALMRYERSSVIKPGELPPAWSVHEDPQMFWYVDRTDASRSTIISKDVVSSLRALKAKKAPEIIITFVAEDFKSVAPYLDTRYLQINVGAVKKAVASTGRLLLFNAEELSWALFSRLLQTDVKRIVLRMNLTKILKSSQSCCLDLLFLARSVNGMPSLRWSTVLLDRDSLVVDSLPVWVSLLTTAHRPVDPKLLPFADKEHRLLQAYFDLRNSRHIGLVATATAFLELASAEGYDVSPWLPYSNIVYFDESVYSTRPFVGNVKRKAESGARPASRKKRSKSAADN